ncbi:T-complex protein 11-like protein 1 [Hydractinia symbiolongicarpus]|uniref:T-complex protein 11-like protein 1 n=1 Tax=Hydractinia symbiolongicarpus TaxID=13093 RepID=UPI00254B4810|nr:T-complex protein 11-like protein 1 [Hydractinia symbiolongicarpus]
MSEDLTKASLSSIIGNMTLAHEMIMNDNFELQSLPEKSFEKQVHDIMHKAFWDLLESEIKENPPKYTHALSLMGEMKKLLLDLLHANHKSLREQVEDTLDEALIKKQVDNNSFDMHACANFILDTLSKLCAPVRDQNIKDIKELTEIVPMMRGIFELINLMKIDMANFELQTLKPVLIQQAVKYEQEKFAEFLEQNPDGLTLTTAWLKGAFEKIEELKKSHPSINITSPLVITHAYLSLMELKDKLVYPETLLLDEVRLKKAAATFENLTFITSILTVSLNFLGTHLSSDTSFVAHLKDTIKILTTDVQRDASLMESIYLQVMVEGEKEWEKKGLKGRNEDEKHVLKNQIADLISEKNQLKSLLKSRIRDHVLLSMTSQNANSPVSNVLSPVQAELKDVTRKYMRVVHHNRNVYISYYTNIVEKLLEDSNGS